MRIVCQMRASVPVYPKGCCCLKSKVLSLSGHPRHPQNPARHTNPFAICPQDHCREVHDLKGSCLDLFVMAEECRCRQDRNRDPPYLQALQQRTLDPSTTQRMRRLRLCAQQIAQGLNDSDAVLDSQWEAHVEKEKKMRSVLGDCLESETE